MGEMHERLVSKFRRTLTNRKYAIRHKSPFVDYRPDIYAVKGKEHIFVEVEIEKTLQNDHTLDQLEKMYKYLKKSKNYKGFLVVPKRAQREAIYLIESVFGDNRILVQSIRI